MKTKSYLIGLLLLAAGLFTFNSHKATADNPHVEAAAVVFSYEVMYNYLPNGDVERWPNGVAKETGLRIGRISRSAAAPEIAAHADLTEAMAILLGNGFELQPPTDRPEFVFTRKPR